MTDEEKLTMLRTLSGASAEVTDATLQAYLTLASDAVLQRAYPSVNDFSTLVVPARYETLQCQIANEIYQKRGAEGELSHNEDGVNRSYESAGVSEALLKRIVPFAHVLGVPFNETT